MNYTKTKIDSAAKKIRAAQFLRFLTLLVCAALFASATFAQTAGGTSIVNQASATYSDGAGGSYSTVSNTVTVTVANVSGLIITPDVGTNRASVVAGQTNVVYSFRITNTGNFADQIRFLANGASVRASAGGTITAAVIDNGNGAIGAGDTDIFGNGAAVDSALIAQNGFVDVLVSVNIGASATGSVTVTLGDATTGAGFDNQPVAATVSANEVRTVSGAPVNGQREARGDLSALIEADAQLVLTLTAPTAPQTLGSNINYSWGVCNTGLRAASSITLPGAPAGSNTGVFIIAPIPVGTSLASGQTFPAGTLFSNSPLTDLPNSAATYTTTAPTTASELAAVRRVAFRAGATLAAGVCSPAFPMQVTITTADATRDIFEIGDAFGASSIGTALTDQSGDTDPNKGDGNANFDEPVFGATGVSGKGFQQRTPLTRTGAVLIGPLNAPTATGPTSNNDDYTNRSVTTGIAGVAFGGNTTASGQIVFSNTIRNTGNADDTFVVTIPSVPTGFTVEISTDASAPFTYTTMTSSNSVSVPIAFGADRTILVRVTAPSGIAVLNGFAVTVRSTSALTSSASNETINRLYTGFVRMNKTFTVTNGTGVGGATDAVKNAVIEYTIAYSNIASTGGSGSLTLSASNLVITENGAAAPNNWASFTDQVVGSASDTRGGVTTTSGITGDTAGSNVLTGTIATLPAQSSGTFKFRRTIR